ncbi:MAG: hypothetical protein CME62_03770 [Halobacteriovoraceae bacterium]|nr:hypothetical protein [Halobacteriovoraceae bacterium]|tara:strand:- start:5082 stop:6152 length:1071 start_codon:yes stop_codon:yes gene_type:complete
MNVHVWTKLILLTLFSCAEIKPLDQKQSPQAPKAEPKTVIDSDPDTETVIVKKVIEPLSLEKMPPQKLSQKLDQYCHKIDDYFARYKWGQSFCHKYDWHHVRNSFLGNPIIWKVFGDETREHANTTLILCGVHGDEITPVKFCFDVLKDLTENPEVIGDNLVIVAPLVTPDSFLKKYPTRTNARGIDVNRNFPTKDWEDKAISLWKNRYRSDKRRFPGKKPHSEHETVFQINLIKLYNPQKIISVHAPLTLIDYDGPAEGESAGKQLLIQMSDRAGKYKVNDYPFFTGSLGNWAGNERKIPTYTLELPNSDWTKTKKFFNIFRNAIHHAIAHDLHADVDDEEKVSKKKNKVDEPVL